MQTRGQYTRLVRSCEHNRTGTITKQDAGSSIIKIKNAREHFRPDHQHALVHAAADEIVSDRHRVNKSAAHCLHIECSAIIGNAKLALHDARSTGKTTEKIGGRSCNDNEIDIIRLESGHIESVTRGRRAQITGEHAIVSEVSRGDATARDNPFIRRIKTSGRQKCCHVVIAHAPWGQTAARAYNASVFTHAVFC